MPGCCRGGAPIARRRRRPGLSPRPQARGAGAVLSLRGRRPAPRSPARRRLRCGGEIIAVHYGFSAKGRSYSYLGGFDGAFAAYSPGLQVLAEAIDQAVAEAAERFDFLRGRDRYKYRWGAVDQPTWRRRTERR